MSTVLATLQAAVLAPLVICPVAPPGAQAQADKIGTGSMFTSRAAGVSSTAGAEAPAIIASAAARSAADGPVLV